jgi:hypothetical protein
MYHIFLLKFQHHDISGAEIGELDKKNTSNIEIVPLVSDGSTYKNIYLQYRYSCALGKPRGSDRSCKRERMAGGHQSTECEAW